MLSLTYRMAVALRRVVDSWDGSAETFVMPTTEARAVVQQIIVLLAEYDAERNAHPEFRVGQFVRSKHEPDNPMWQGEVTGVLSEGLVFFKTSYGPASAMHYSLELVLNLPATNTGD